MCNVIFGNRVERKAVKWYYSAYPVILKENNTDK